MEDVTFSEVEIEENKTYNKNKSRRSLFLPPEITISETTKSEISDEEYINKLKLEQEAWKKLYNEQKEQRKKLLSKLESNEARYIDYGLFTEEEIKYINGGPDISTFIRETEELQNLVKSASLQCEAQRLKYNNMLENIENSCLNMTSTINS